MKLIFYYLAMFLLPLAATAAEGALVGLAARRLLAPRSGWFKRAAPYVIFAASAQLPSWIGDENTLILLPFFLGVFLFCYEGTPLARLVTSNMFYLLLVPVNMILDSVERWNIWTLGELLVTLVKPIFALGLLVLIRRLTAEGERPALSDRLWALCGLLSLAPLFATLSLAIWNGFSRRTIDEAQLRLAYTFLPFVTLSAAALLIAVTVLARHEALEQANQLAQMRELYYESLQKQETQVRTLRHDLRNHLTLVQGFLESGDAARATAYLAELTASPALHGVRRICGNETANVVLSCKLEQMERQGLRADFLVTLPEALAVADADLCALLGNALDNAIEAAAQTEEKTVTLRLRADHGMLMLRVENPCRTAPVETAAGFRTTKRDAGAHGFGLRAMRAIAGQYGGTLDAKAADGRFELIVCLPLTQH